jgi:hypothetical protein
MILKTFNKALLTLYICGSAVNIYAVDTSSHETLASKEETIAANAGIVGGITAYILANTIIEQVCKLQQEKTHTRYCLAKKTKQNSFAAQRL